MGLRDEVNNLLEMGSTIKSVNIDESTGHSSFTSIKSPEDWLTGAETQGNVLCFGCKRLLISSSSRSKIVEGLP